MKNRFFNKMFFYTIFLLIHSLLRAQNIETDLWRFIRHHNTVSVGNIILLVNSARVSFHSDKVGRGSQSWSERKQTCYWLLELNLITTWMRQVRDRCCVFIPSVSGVLSWWGHRRTTSATCSDFLYMAMARSTEPWGGAVFTTIWTGHVFASWQKSLFSSREYCTQI